MHSVLRRFVAAAFLLAALPAAAAAQDLPEEYQAVLGSLGKKGDFKDSVFNVQRRIQRLLEDSHSLGTNTRLRSTVTPAADLFVVYNHNVRSILDRWRLDSNQLLVKLQHAWRL